MVGCSNSKDSMESNGEDVAAAEIRILKTKNNELAKALADVKVSLKQSVDERDYFQKQLLNMHLRNSELLNYLKHVDQAARKSINAIVLSSNYITEIAQITMASMQRSDLANNSIAHTGISPTPSSGKLHAVKPMIDGHVIHRPTISLRRVNEIPLEEIQRLRTAPQTQNVNGVMNRDENTENNPYRRISSAGASHGRAFNDNNSHNSSDGSEDGMEDDYVEGASNVSEPEGVNNNRLHTIQELSESINDSTRLEEDLSTLVNASTSSASIPAPSNQGSLLSGVFRDVRVYLSPMQNMSQYLESLQSVTTDRRKSYSSRKALRKQFSPRTVSLNDNNQCVVTVNSPVSCSDQSNNNSDTVNNSFDDPTSSILTSTRIGNNFDDTCRARNSEYVNKSRWTNSFNNITADENVHLNNSEQSFNKNPKWNAQGSRLSDQHYVTSLQSPSMQSTAYDPLEGPSTLLDGNSNNCIEKLERLSMLGLQPTSRIESLSNSSSPAARVLKRRERDQQETTPKKKNKSIYVTKRKLNGKKAVVSTKLINKRTLCSPLKISQIKKHLSSSLKRNSSSDSSRKDSRSPKKQMVLRQHLRTPKKRKSTSKRIVYTEITPRSEKRKLKKNSSRKHSGQKVKNRKIKSECLEQNPKIKVELNTSQNSSTASTSTMSHTVNSDSKYVNNKKKNIRNSNKNDSRNYSESPKKSPKMKRIIKAKMSSFKEPSLRKKLRRS